MAYLQKVWAMILAHKWVAIGALAALVALVAYVVISRNDTISEPEAGLRAVQLVQVADYAQGALGVAVPTAGGNTFVVRAESSGKVTRAARIGAVSRGAVIAQLDGAAQRAALTQAEGAYEAAVAAAGGNKTSQQSAQQDAVHTWTSATVAAAETVRTSIDGYYADVRGAGGARGFALNAFGEADKLNNMRTAIEAVFDHWESAQVSETNVAGELSTLSSDLVQIGGLIDSIAALVPRQEVTSVYTEADRSADTAALAAARASITALQGSVDGARTAVTNTSNTGDATAQAQVKQALGALQAARSSYDKTIVRAPFDGTLSAVNVAVGDVVMIGNDVALVVPDEGVDTARSFSLPLSAVKYTPAGALVFTVTAEGVLESKSVETGLVTANTITVTGLNGDENIVKDVRGLKTGEKVAIEGE